MSNYSNCTDTLRATTLDQISDPGTSSTARKDMRHAIRGITDKILFIRPNDNAACKVAHLGSDGDVVQSDSAGLHGVSKHLLAFLVQFATTSVPQFETFSAFLAGGVSLKKGFHRVTDAGQEGDGVKHRTTRDLHGPNCSWIANDVASDHAYARVTASYRGVFWDVHWPGGKHASRLEVLCFGRR